MVEVNCLVCKKRFEAQPAEIKRGNGKYCSRGCNGKAASIRYRNEKNNKPPNATCAYCDETFYRRPSKLKLSKSGIHFCCREHKDLAQRIEGVEGIHPTHYKDGTSCYRKRALRSHGEYCNRCGFYDVPEVLRVHHKDRDRDNSKLENLEVLCPTCHDIEHFIKKDGRYKGKPE